MSAQRWLALDRRDPRRKGLPTVEVVAAEDYDRVLRGSDVMESEWLERNAQLVEALSLIRAHARLDLSQRGIAEADRYAVIADDALTARDPARGSMSYRVRDRDSDYKAMCHEDRDHAELLLKAWLADGRDAVVERRHVFDGGWLPVGRPFFTGQQERALDRCEAFDAANPEPETDT